MDETLKRKESAVFCPERRLVCVCVCVGSSTSGTTMTENRATPHFLPGWPTVPSSAVQDVRGRAQLLSLKIDLHLLRVKYNSCCLLPQKKFNRSRNKMTQKATVVNIFLFPEWTRSTLYSFVQTNYVFISLWRFCGMCSWAKQCKQSHSRPPGGACRECRVFTFPGSQIDIRWKPELWCEALILVSSFLNISI